MIVPEQEGGLGVLITVRKQESGLGVSYFRRDGMHSCQIFEIIMLISCDTRLTEVHTYHHSSNLNIL